MYIKLTEKEILDYAIAEEGLLFASANDYLAIADIVIEQINAKLILSSQAQPISQYMIEQALEIEREVIIDMILKKINSTTPSPFSELINFISARNERE